MKIYENANDQHVRKVVIYEVPAGLAFDKAGTELLSKEQIVDAFLKGCVVENEGNYKTPTGVNVTNSGAELVFGGGSGGPEVENAIETGGLGWTESEPKAGFDITWDGNTEGLEDIAGQAYKVAEVDDIASKDDLIGAKIEPTGMYILSSSTLSADDISTEDGKVFVCSVGEVPLLFVAIEDGEAYSMQFTKGVWFLKTNEDAYISRFYKEASTEEVVHKIDQKYIPQAADSTLENAIETGGLGWTESEPKEGFDVTWDGDTTGLDVIEGALYKIADVDSITSASDLIGSAIEVVGMEIESPHILSSAEITTEDNKVFACSVASSALMFVAFEDGTAYDISFTKGVWFSKISETAYVTHFYKEASTEEVVHQIDEKYIPSGGSGSGGMVVHFNLTEDEEPPLSSDKTVAEVKTAMSTMPVSAIFSEEGKEDIPLFLSCGTDFNSIMMLGFAYLFTSNDGATPMMLVYEQDGEWAAAL